MWLLPLFCVSLIKPETFPRYQSKRCPKGFILGLYPVVFIEAIPPHAIKFMALSHSTFSTAMTPH